MEVRQTYGPMESGAMRLILGMLSNEPGSAGGTTSCSLSACKRLLGAEVMMKVEHQAILFQEE